MLGHATTENLNNDIRNISSNIASLEQQLAILREEKKRKENELQAVQTYVAAGNSSLEQAEKYLTATTRADRFDLVASFWEEMDALRERYSQQPIADLPPASDKGGEPIEPQPEPEDSGNGGAISIEIGEVEEELTEVTQQPEEESDPATEKPIPQSVGAAALDIEALSMGDLQRECLDTKGLTKAQIKEYGVLTRKSTWLAAYRDN